MSHWQQRQVLQCLVRWLSRLGALSWRLEPLSIMIIVPDVILELLHSFVSAWLSQFRRKDNFNRRQNFLRYSGQIMWAHRLECRDTSRPEFLALSSAIFENSSTKVHRITKKVRQKLAPIRESKTVLGSGSHAVWIPDSSHWITIFVSRAWILDSTLRGIPDPLRSIPDSQAQGTFSGFSNKDSHALGEKTVTVTWNFNFFKKMVDFNSYRSYDFWGVNTVAVFIGS